MQKRNIKVAAFIGSVLGTAALTGAAVMGTGAYFQDSEDGTVSAKVGSIKIDGANLALDFNGILPGDVVSDGGSFTNTGTSAQDVYFVVDTAATQVLNQAKALGTIKVNGAVLPASGVVKVADLNPGQGANFEVSYEMHSSVTEASGAMGVTLPSTAAYKIVATQDGKALR